MHPLYIESLWARQRVSVYIYGQHNYIPAALQTKADVTDLLLLCSIEYHCLEIESHVTACFGVMLACQIAASLIRDENLSK